MHTKLQPNWLLTRGLQIRNLIDKLISFSCICPVIDHEFHHNIVKVDPQGDSRLDLQTTLH